MNKLMIGLAAAGLCSAVFADVTSANVVGYQGVKLPEGRQMTCATFKNMTDTGMWLSDLMVIGYKNGMAEEFINEEGTGTYFSFQILNSTGGLVKEYYWRETLDDPWGEPTWADDGCWKDKDGVVVQGHNKDTDVWLDKGSAVWFYAPEIFDGLETDGYALQNAGEVLTLAQQVPMRNDGRMAIGNPFPIDCWLSKISVTGYHDCTEMDDFINEEGTGTFFSFQLLNDFGGLKAEYYWRETLDDPWGEPTWAGDGCWKDKDGTVVYGENLETDVIIKSGTGMWTLAPDFWGSDGYYMVFPGLKL